MQKALVPLGLFPHSCGTVCLLLVWLVSSAYISTSAAVTSADKIYQTTGVQGGLVVHLGCGDGRLTATLRSNMRYTIHGLEADATKVESARQHIMSLGLYGAVSVEQFTSDRLPYRDNLVNLVVVENPGAVTMTEIMRVLAPRGVACVRAGDTWKTSTKPVPGNIDEWTHFLHDAGNNAVAKDSVVGPPQSLQWVASPLWLRSHETPSGFEALVTSGGRLFYIFDEGLIGITDQRLPERWALICRDAWNGKLLWRRPLEKWGWPEWAPTKFADQDWTTITGGRTVVPEENQRRLVAEGNRLYATLSYQAPLSIIDAATGDVLHTVKETAPASEILAEKGIILVVSQSSGTAGKGKKRAAKTDGGGTTLFGIQASSGKILWKKTVGAVGSLFTAIENGRAIYQDGNQLVAVDMQIGKELWQVPLKINRGRVLAVNEGVAVIMGGVGLEAHECATGRQLWLKEVSLSGGIEGSDLFIIQGTVYPGMKGGDEGSKKTRKADAIAIGYDLRTGEEKKRIEVKNLRSPEHHHRCYRNKATERYLFSAMEGCEFLDLQGSNHSQNNWLRGACRLGVMPANGMLYVPPDQCFCEPGAKLLGFTAVSSEAVKVTAVADSQRLHKGPAFGSVQNVMEKFNPEDWPTFRHDPERHAATPSVVSANVAPAWRVNIGSGLTAPVAGGGRVLVAAREAHTIHALDAQTGKTQWRFTAGGRIDSPPTLYQGLVMFGSADGQVYCLRASDGALVWRFLAAPCDVRMTSFDQVESIWPVHGSVLLRDGIAYVSAGRSTYLDGGIRLYGLNPKTGAIIHHNTLSGPFPDLNQGRDYSFYVLGANSDVLVSEGNSLYLRQKKLSPQLQEITNAVLSTKGEQDVGTHVFSTAGLLDGSWYNRAFWMYTKRWPGFQLANQAPKSGQLLVVDDANTYAVKVFYRRNVHSTMFFPGKDGYLIFADKNTNEPQIVGEEGSRTPIAWLPQSDYVRKDGMQKLDSPAFGLDKMIGYTRAEPSLWQQWVPVHVRAMVKAGDCLFAAGAPDVFDEKDPYATFEGRKGARLIALSAKDGKKLSDAALDVVPVFDGLIAAGQRLFLSLEDGSLACFASAPKR